MDMKLSERFDKAEDEYGKFDRVTYKLSSRPDLHAFILLDKILSPSTEVMVSCSGHDQYYLGVDCDELNEVATDDQIAELVRCRVQYTAEEDSLFLFT